MVPHVPALFAEPKVGGCRHGLSRASIHEDPANLCPVLRDGKPGAPGEGKNEADPFGRCRLI